MNLNFSPFQKTTNKAIAFALIGLSVTLSSCKLDAPEPIEIAALTIINAAPKATAIDFYLDNNRVNNSEFSFGAQTDYLNVFPGNRRATVKVGGKSEVWYEKNIVMTAGVYQSLYVIENADSLAFLITKDEFTKPAEGSAKVRFINLSPDAPELSLTVEGDTTAFSGTYKNTTAFKNIKVKASHRLVLRNKTSGAELANLGDVAMTSGRFYTFWAKGLINTTETNKKISIKANKPM